MFPLPTAEQIISGTETIKPLQHDSAALHQFIEQFEHVPVNPETAEMLSNISHHLKQPEWVKAHDEAHKALLDAFENASRGTTPELIADTRNIKGFMESRLPSASSLKVIKSAELQAALTPVSSYLDTWGKFLIEWTKLTGPRMNPREDVETTLGKFRMETPEATHTYTAKGAASPATSTPSYKPYNSRSEGFTLEPHVHGPNCNHGPTESASTVGTSEPHVHGPNCNHGTYEASSGSSHSKNHDPHIHGPDCNHEVHFDPEHGQFSLEQALPKGKAARWALAGVGATMVGAFLINALGKKDAGEELTEAEKTKSKQKKANDIAYTVNHAVSCGTTDVILQPIIAATFGINVGCNHPGHNHPKEKLTLKSFAHEAGHYFKGEIIGDFVAVPLTIGVQRTFPNFMHGIRKGIEPVIGWAFRLGADHNAKKWAEKAGFASDAPEVKKHADRVYEHEISHLPQAVVWNMFAYPIGAFAQKAMGHGQAYPQIFKSKLVGAMVSNGILLGGRMIAPEPAQKWDDFTADKVFLPTTKIVGKIFGIDQKTMEEAAKNQKHGDDIWQGRVTGNEPSPSTPHV